MKEFTKSILRTVLVFFVAFLFLHLFLCAREGAIAGLNNSMSFSFFLGLSKRYLGSSVLLSSALAVTVSAGFPFFKKFPTRLLHVVVFSMLVSSCVFVFSRASNNQMQIINTKIKYSMLDYSDHFILELETDQRVKVPFNNDPVVFYQGEDIASYGHEALVDQFWDNSVFTDSQLSFIYSGVNSFAEWYEALRNTSPYLYIFYLFSVFCLIKSLGYLFFSSPRTIRNSGPFSIIVFTVLCFPLFARNILKEFSFETAWISGGFFIILSIMNLLLMGKKK